LAVLFIGGLGFTGWELKMLKKMPSAAMLKIGGAAFAAVAALAGSTRSSDAALILYVDGSPVANDGGSGVVHYSGTIAGFSTDFVFGLTDLATTTSPYAYLQVQTFEVTNSGNSSASLDVSLVETTPFTFPGTGSALLGFNSSAAGTLNPQKPTDSVTFDSIATPVGGSPIELSGAASISAGTVNVPVSTTYFAPETGYTLENDLDVTLAGGETASINGSTNVFTPTSPVPEPASIALLATAALACVGRRRRALIGSGQMSPSGPQAGPSTNWGQSLPRCGVPTATPRALGLRPQLVELRLVAIEIHAPLIPAG
jgi:hypothetical protein